MKKFRYYLNIAFSPVLFFTFLFVNIIFAIKKSSWQFVDAWEQNERYFKQVNATITKSIGGKDE